MDFRVRLVHADGQQRVVVVQAFEGERCLGSALGEASNAEVAEDRARDRLRQRLRGEGEAANRPPPGPPPPTVVVGMEAASPQPGGPGGPLPRETSSGPSLPRPSAQGEEPPADPEDWSADLAQLDRLLRQLGWGREEERVYLQRLFGQPSRSRLTRHGDLMALRRALEALAPGCRPEHAPLPPLRSELLSQCDDLLERLGWPTEQARQCLERQFAVNSRQRLNDDQLLAFNLFLEGELLERTG